MARLLLLSILSVSAWSQTLTFSPQATLAGRGSMQIWAVTGCFDQATRPPTSAAVYALATRHEIPWLNNAVANYRLVARVRRSKPWLIAHYAGYAAAGLGFMMTLNVVQASMPWQQGVLIGSGLLNTLLPLTQKDIPAIDPGVAAQIMGSSLLQDNNGCASAVFFAEPSKVAAFTDAVQ